MTDLNAAGIFADLYPFYHAIVTDVVVPAATGFAIYATNKYLGLKTKESDYAILDRVVEKAANNVWAGFEGPAIATLSLHHDNPIIIRAANRAIADAPKLAQAFGFTPEKFAEQMRLEVQAKIGAMQNKATRVEAQSALDPLGKTVSDKAIS